MKKILKSVGKGVAVATVSLFTFYGVNSYAAAWTPDSSANPRGGEMNKNIDKHLSAQDAKTIMQGRLLMRGIHELKVGKVSPATLSGDRSGYTIDIVNQSNVVVKEFMMDSKTGQTIMVNKGGAHANNNKKPAPVAQAVKTQQQVPGAVSRDGFS